MTATTVTVCGCGHVERMHERDSGAEHDRGACMHGACGCSEFRPGARSSGTPAPSTTAAPRAPIVVTDKPAIVATQPAAPEPIPTVQPTTPSPSATPGKYHCTEPGCDAEPFNRPQALGAHRRYKHSGRPVNTRPDLHPNDTTEPPEGANEGSRADRPSAPADTPDDTKGREPESGNPTREDHQVVVLAVAPAAVTRGIFALNVHFDLGDNGRVDIHADQLTRTDLDELLATLAPLTEENP